MNNMKEVDGLCEIVHDISSNLAATISGLDEKRRDRLMDFANDSRGLFWDYVLPWAKEYQKRWETLGEAERENYLVDVDTFASKRITSLLSKLGEIGSIQIIPVARTQDEVMPQFDGPDEQTTGWAVYERSIDGMAHWVADFDKEEYADMFGAALAAKYIVPIEARPWKLVKQAEIVKETAPAERFLVEWTIDVDAVSSRDAALKAREIQRDPRATVVFRVYDDHGSAPVRINLKGDSA